MNNYLRLKKQPSTETEFQERYGLEMKKASGLLKKLHEAYKKSNPTCSASYSRSYRPCVLTFFFEHAAKDYEAMQKRINEVNCEKEPLHYFIATVCNEPAERLEELIIKEGL